MVKSYDYVYNKESFTSLLQLATSNRYRTRFLFHAVPDVMLNSAHIAYQRVLLTLSSGPQPVQAN